MRPIRLAIEGLRSFRSPETIDFTDRDHVAIVGDTGAGKSSILEAITYALYGQSTFTAQGNQELMNDTSTHLRVVLRFRVSGETWEVARALRRDGQGKVTPAGAQLRRIGDDDAAVEQFEKVKPVNERIEQLIGLDSDAFLRTVILPQGRFARLLVEDKPTERGRILRQVWRTDDLEQAGALAGAARAEATALRERLEGAAALHPDDPAAHRAKLESACMEARAGAAAATAREQKAAAAREDLTEARAEEAAAGGARRAAAEVAASIDGAEKKLAPIAARAQEIEAAAAAVEQRRTDVERRLAQVPDDGDGPSREDVASALATLPVIVPRVAAAATAADDWRASAQAAAILRDDAGQAAERAALAEQETARQAAGRPALAAAVDTANGRRVTVTDRYAACEARKTERDDARQALAALRTDHADVARELEPARAAAHTAAGERSAADERLAAARRTETAAAAARGLRPGDACPVCLRGLPDGWTAPEGVGLAAAESAATAANTAADGARDRATTLTEKLNGIERRIGQATDRSGAAEGAFGTALAALGQAAGTELRDVPDRAALFSPLDAVAREASDALAQHDRKQEKMRSASNRLSAQAAAAGEKAAGAARLAAAQAKAAAAALTLAADAVRAVPAPFRPALNLPADVAEPSEVDTTAVDERTTAARRRERVLTERANTRDGLQSELGAVAEERTALLQRRAAEVERPLDDLARDLDEHRFALRDAAREIGPEVDVPAAIPTKDAAALTERTGALRLLAERVADAAASRLDGASKKASAARGSLAEIAELLNDDIDRNDVEAVVGAVRGIAEEARFAERQARDEAKRFAAIFDDVVRLNQLLRAAREQERSLRDLEDALKPGAFPKWLTMRRSRRLLVHASRMLGEMSAGKYAFADPGDAEAPWQVLDTESGRTRSPASLSGGEQFIASLSLALGMVEMMARSGGRLESLFLDEGFGSLDRNNLDAAVQSLGTVAAGGRMVGVISHVRAVAEQIEHVLAVTRSAVGSKAEWLGSAQRRRLSESDTGWEAASALAGLLE